MSSHSETCAKSFHDQMIKPYPIIKSTEFFDHLPVPDMEPTLHMCTHKAVENNAHCSQELKCIVKGTEAKVYVDEFDINLEFQAAWRKLYNTFLSFGAKDMLAAQLEKTIQNLCYNRLKYGFMFTTYVEHHKAVYQSMLALAAKTDCTTNDPSTHVHHFLNGITDPAVIQAKLSLKAYCYHYSGNFDTTVEYLMSQVSHHQVNQQLAIACFNSVAPGCLKTHDDCCNNL